MPASRSSSTPTAEEAPDEVKSREDENKEDVEQVLEDVGSSLSKEAKVSKVDDSDPEQQSPIKNKTHFSILTTTSSSETSGIPGAFRVAPSTGTRSSSIEIYENSEISNHIETTEHSAPDATITTNEITDNEITDADVEVASGITSPKVMTAYLVQEKPVAEVETIKPFYQRTEGKRTIGLVACLVVGMSVLVGVLLASRGAELEEELVPSMAPSQAPTFDPRPTLEVVQGRGVVNCGIEDVAEGAETFVQYNTDFCRGLAAILFGDPEKFNSVSVGDDRYDKLLGREVDVLFAGDTLTVEKMIKEPTTGSGFAFGFPYYSAAVVYAGPPAYVQCANAQKRFDECQDLSICAVDTPDLLSLLPQYFPESFITYGPFPLMEAYLKEGKCNVIVSDTYRLSGSSLQKYIDSGVYVISDYYISRNLLASVVRYGDSEWYDIVEASRLSRFRATQMGFYQNTSACNELAEQQPSDSLSFYNSPICVGNSVQVFQRSLGETVISFGTYLSAIDAPTLGSFECSDCEDVLDSGKLKAIRDRGQLNCAVYLDPAHNLTRSSLATLVNEKFCQLLGVVIFQGDHNATNITYIDQLEYTDFPSEFDVVAGAGWEGKTSNSWDPTNVGSMGLTYPYFIHDKYRHDGKIYDGLGFHLSFAIDNEDHDLNLLATTVIIATIYAQRQEITKVTHSDMPLIYLFGDSLTFMMRDLIAYGGNYDEILQEALENSDGTTEIGWNTVIPSYNVAAKTPVLYCDFTGNCPPCMWIDVEGYPVCVSVGPY